eukprot:UN2711
MDVTQVRWVFNLDVPRDPDSYVPRCARPCRYAPPGWFFSFLREEDDREASVMLGPSQEFLGISLEELPADFAEFL